MTKTQQDIDTKTKQDDESQPINYIAYTQRVYIKYMFFVARTFLCGIIEFWPDKKKLNAIKQVSV